MSNTRRSIACDIRKHRARAKKLERFHAAAKKHAAKYEHDAAALHAELERVRSEIRRCEAFASALPQKAKRRAKPAEKKRRRSVKRSTRRR